MGLHSTLFKPVKYAYLPQQLELHELVEGNGLIEMGTFVAILVGTIGAGLLVERFGAGAPVAVAVAVVVIALFGRLMAGSAVGPGGAQVLRLQGARDHASGVHR